MKKAVCIILIAVFVVTLIPILAIAPYNHPAYDDYIYGQETHAVIQDDGSLNELLKAAVSKTKSFYHIWQGTYNAIFLMCLQPDIFGESFYSVTPFIMILSLIGATLFLFSVILRRYLKFDVWSYLIVTLLALELSIQMLSSAAEGFFWYDGAILYTFFYALGLCLFALLLLVFSSKTTAGKVIFSSFAILLAMLIGGGNYTTLLVCWIVVALMLGWQIYKKNIGNAVIAGVVFAILTIFGALSVFSPGSAARHSVFQSAGLIKALLICFAAGGASLIKNINPTTALLVMTTVFLTIPFVKKTELKFCRPWLVLLVGFCVYCAQVMPTAYVAGSIGPYRMRNIIYFSYYILVIVSTVWFTGNLARKFECNETAIKLWSYVRSKIKTVSVIAVMTVFTAASAIQYGLWGFTSLSAAKDLITGEAQRYGAFYQQQLTVLTDDSVTDAVLEKNPYKVGVFLVGALEEGAPEGSLDIANYYGKNSVVIK